MHRECRERFPRHRLQRKPLVSDPGMHHSTCVTHVPWCMSGLLTGRGGENVPGIPGACANHNFTYLVRGPCCSGALARISDTYSLGKVGGNVRYHRYQHNSRVLMSPSTKTPMTGIVHCCSIKYRQAKSKYLLTARLMSRISYSGENHGLKHIAYGDEWGIPNGMDFLCITGVYLYSNDAMSFMMSP